MTWFMRAIGRARHVDVPSPLLPLVALLAIVVGGLYVLLMPLIGLGAIVWFAAVGAWRALATRSGFRAGAAPCAGPASPAGRRRTG
jgi:hypothetical protein